MGRRIAVAGLFSSMMSCATALLSTQGLWVRIHRFASVILWTRLFISPTMSFSVSSSLSGCIELSLLPRMGEGAKGQKWLLLLYRVSRDEKIGRRKRCLLRYFLGGELAYHSQS